MVHSQQSELQRTMSETAYSDRHDKLQPDIEQNSDALTPSCEYHDSESEQLTLRDSLSAISIEQETPSERSFKWPEHRIPTASKLGFLALWLVLNLSMTLLNKAALKVFLFPWLLTCLQCSVSAIGICCLYLRGYFTLSTVDRNDQAVIYAISILFTANIAISNVSLALVSVPFHQIMRAGGPVLTITLQRIIFNRSYSIQTYVSSFCIIFGVAMVTFGDYDFTFLGFGLTLLGVILASLKGIVTNHVMTGRLALPVLEFLHRSLPLAALQCAVFASLNGELKLFWRTLEAGSLSFTTCALVLGNSFLAFFLNMISFQSNKSVGALTMAIAGNLKQCLTILISVALFHVTVGPFFIGGLIIALMGAAWYSKIELQTKK